MRCVVFVCQSADLYMMNFSKGELVQRGQYAVKGKYFLMLKSTGAVLCTKIHSLFEKYNIYIYFLLELSWVVFLCTK